jgi:uncharacterized protein YbbC (DUF1343 family)
VKDLLKANKKIVSKLQKAPVKLGLEKILDEQISSLKNMHVGLICNQASVNHRYKHAADLFFEHPDINLAALFGPQHGIRGDVQDNMIETKHSVDKKTNLPVYSLYSQTREPNEEMLEDLDALVFDLQDVGTRVYTFIYTMANSMRACAKFSKKMFVLDRPNPIGGLNVEGDLLERGHESFVGQFPIPMRHGLTVAELALLFNKEFGINCDLTVIKMDGWQRSYFYDETDCPWVLPSPNMPTVETTIVFPGTVLFEGTQVSEGRGTTRPFEIIGAPFIDENKLADALKSLELEGVVFRPTKFLPTFQKHQGETCGGVFIHVIDRERFQPVITGYALVNLIYNLYKENFKWKNPPYEYEHDRNPFDVIAGTLKTRKFIEKNEDIKTVKQYWRENVKVFEDLRNKYLLY